MGCCWSKPDKVVDPPIATALNVSRYDGREKSYYSSNIASESIIRFAKEGTASKEECPPMTIPEMFNLAVQRFPKKTALGVESPVPWCDKQKRTFAPPMPLADWKTWSYEAYYEESLAVAKGMIALGLQRFDAVSIYGFNSPQWFMGEMGAILAGGVAAGIYPTDTAEQIKFKARHSGTSIAVVESEKHLETFRSIAEYLPKLKAVIVWAPKSNDSNLNEIRVGRRRTVEVLKWDELTALGREQSDRTVENRIASQSPGHVCALIYTSGTTGDPKAVMITHDNIVFEVRNAMNLMPPTKENEQERILSYLPLSHVAGMLVDVFTNIASAAFRPGYVTIYFARPYDLKLGSIGDRLKTVKPTFFLGVPRVWEKIAEKLKKVGSKSKGLKKLLVTWAKSKGKAHQDQMQLIPRGSGAYPCMYGLADTLILSKIKQALGLEHCKFGFTGAAPITKDTLSFFGALGIQINEVYGMSECTGATTWSTDNTHVWGSCGFAMEGTEVKIFKVDPSDPTGTCKAECPRAMDMFNATEEEQGEICFRGRHIMAGYMANRELGRDHVKQIEKKNRSAIDEEGWLHSGDKGCMSVEGMVKITGRYKELIIGAGGENIAPVPIEDNIKALHPGISNVMMVGDKRKFNIALLTLKAKGATGEFPGSDELDGPALDIVKGVNTISSAISEPKWIKTIQDAIEKTNNSKACPSNASKIRKFGILPTDFSVTTNELGPTLKLKRSVACKKYKEYIDEFYKPENVKKDYIAYPY
eukprot:g5416.t1